MAQHPQPGRRRPARRHPAPARTPALHDHPQRIRRRPGRARQRPQRGHPARQSRAAGTRQGARDPRQREPRARETRSRLRQGARPVRESPRSGRGLHRAEPTRSRRRAPPRAARWRATCSCSRPSSNSSGRRWNASSTSPNRRRRRSPTSKPPRPGSTRRSRSLPAFSSSSEKFFTNLGKTAKVSGPALDAVQAAAQTPEDARQRRRCRSRATSPRCSTSLRNTGGLERIMDFIFLGTGAANGYDALGHFLRAEGRRQRVPRPTQSSSPRSRTAAASCSATRVLQPKQAPRLHRRNGCVVWIGLRPAS